MIDLDSLIQSAGEQLFILSLWTQDHPQSSQLAPDPYMFNTLECMELSLLDVIRFHCREDC